MDTRTILLIIFPVVSGIISSWITYLFTIKVKKNENIIRFKEEKYGNLLIYLQGFVGNTASGEIKKKFFEEQYKSWLYASDKVIKSMNELINLLIEQKGQKPDEKKGHAIIGNIILEMRKDLLGKTNLKNNDFRYTDVRE
ncbi:MAG: hypothetical protein ACD_18C00229G0007 [uncultured bacterium]|nr:MAG: hypothetical protein ACD_18C00229G0007 [uncultured bacterium]OGH83596.1 MAG: hypothetical protein A2488_00250 [Candidatus Magasanikbacteria bacterium RIFOXYC12_FULL_32_21b]OGH89143.1 MAG: hypothetical protein A2507_00645 [Candidatus Magasanikbacteria bacterium RIFOXYD12_FULL_33_17]HAO52878.1 hypothetical protein [Candidatus Magasanikbacteria bacterium]